MTPIDNALDRTRSNELALPQFTPYRIPPHLMLVDTDVVEGEFIYDVQPRTVGGREEWFIYATLVEDAPSRETQALESCSEPVDESAAPPDDVHPPKSERPVGVRVQWKRPTELFAELGAYAAAKGMDFTAALSERLINREPNTSTEYPKLRKPQFERLNPYANHDYRAQTPASPETIHL